LTNLSPSHPKKKKNHTLASPLDHIEPRHLDFMAVILAAQETEMRRVLIQSRASKQSLRPYLKKKLRKKTIKRRASRVTQGVTAHA
jgi:hypothetical protein